MIPSRHRVIVAIASAITLGACAYPGPQQNVPVYAPQPYGQPNVSRGEVVESRYARNTGVIGAIEMVRGASSPGSSTGGTIIGAVVGGLLGHQVGEGRGNTAATLAGAAGGALAGNAIGQRTQTSADSYRVTVQYDAGGSQLIEVPSIGDLRTGDRVRVDNGQISRY